MPSTNSYLLYYGVSIFIVVVQFISLILAISSYQIIQSMFFGPTGQTGVMIQEEILKAAAQEILKSSILGQTGTKMIDVFVLTGALIATFAASFLISTMLHMSIRNFINERNLRRRSGKVPVIAIAIILMITVISSIPLLFASSSIAFVRTSIGIIISIIFSIATLLYIVVFTAFSK